MKFDEFMMERYMKEAERRIKDHLPTGCYVDDCGYSDNAIQINIFSDSDPTYSVKVNHFFFQFDETDAEIYSFRELFDRELDTFIDENYPDDDTEPEILQGKFYSNFETGGMQYQVRSYEDTTYGEVFKIWWLPDDAEWYCGAQPKVIHTIYCESWVDTFIKNMMAGNVDYDRNL